MTFRKIGGEWGLDERPADQFTDVSSPDAEQSTSRPWRGVTAGTARSKPRPQHTAYLGGVFVVAATLVDPPALLMVAAFSDATSFFAESRLAGGSPSFPPVNV